MASTDVVRDVRSRNDQIVDAALELFAERGYHATTMNDIAAI